MRLKKLFVSNKGFFSVFGIIVLGHVLVLSTLIILMMKNNLYALKADEFIFTEIYTINKIKKDYTNYEEENETFTYKDDEVSLVYDDLACYITYRDSRNKIIKAVLIFDDIDLFIRDYYYE